MTPAQHLNLHQLRHAVLGARDRGRVVIEFTDGPGSAIDLGAARHLGDAMLALTNLPPLGPHWRQVDRARAAQIIAAVLHEDLQQETSRVPRKVAETLAERTLAFFGDDALFLTNIKPTADLENESPHKWASGRAGRELDAGVAIVSDTLVGLVWVEDRP